MNPLKQKYLQDEVKYLLENDFIEPSQSNYSSPCILVSKSNGTYRMCTDYRKVNSVTKTDSFPIPRIDAVLTKLEILNMSPNLTCLKDSGKFR